MMQVKHSVWTRRNERCVCFLVLNSVNLAYMRNCRGLPSDTRFNEDSKNLRCYGWTPHFYHICRLKLGLWIRWISADQTHWFRTFFQTWFCAFFWKRPIRNQSMFSYYFSIFFTLASKESWDLWRAGFVIVQIPKTVQPDKITAKACIDSHG